MCYPLVVRCTHCAAVLVVNIYTSPIKLKYYFVSIFYAYGFNGLACNGLHHRKPKRARDYRFAQIKG